RNYAITGQTLYLVRKRKPGELSFRRSFVPESPNFRYEIPAFRFAPAGMTGLFVQALFMLLIYMVSGLTCLYL
ncbi:MAG: hypothetical protein ACT6FF_04875, partial [Methanosarcinaceae archaeon]